MRTGQPAADFWTPHRISQITGGRWLVRPSDENIRLAGVSIDTRTISSGEVFLAVRGDRFDGHNFLGRAVTCGAKMLVVSNAANVTARAVGGVLLVNDTIRALQELAGAYRGQLRRGGTTVIGVTGSNGKTTTRHLIYSILSGNSVGSQSPKSFNNHIGVPLTLLAAKPDSAFVVIELGSNAPGEIASLAAFVQPDVAVLTHIGSAHLGQFGSRQTIAAEKASLLKHIQSGGLAIVPGDEPLLKPYLNTVPSGVTLLQFGTQTGCDLRLTRCDCHKEGLTLTAVARDQGNGRCSRFHLPLLGRHNAVNALAAICVGRWMGVPDTLIVRGLDGVTGVHMRLTVTCIGPAAKPLVMINDTYNASPDSVAAAIGVLAQYPRQAPKASDRSARDTPHGRRVLVLGDMLELGEAGPQLHRDVGRRIANETARIDLVILAGPLSAYTVKGLGSAWPNDRVRVFDRWDQNAIRRTADMVQPGDVVLIKGSRAMGLERLVQQIESAVDPNDAGPVSLGSEVSDSL